ncbi:hypothetical protein Bca4012_037498 [Brassica carinata]
MGITRTWRVEAASSYSLKLVGLSKIKAGTNIRPYESNIFTASGYQWRLVFYPLGNENDGGKDHISLYVRLETLVTDLPENWEIHMDMKFLVFNQNHKKYLTVQAQFIELSTLKDQKNGYAVKDTYIFGVDIAILKPAEKLETVTFLHNPPNNKFTWKILHFSNMSDQIFVLSDQFLSGKRYCGGPGYGIPKLISQKDLYDESKGFLVKDTIILEVEMLCMSHTEVISY